MDVYSIIVSRQAHHLVRHITQWCNGLVSDIPGSKEAKAVRWGAREVANETLRAPLALSQGKTNSIYQLGFHEGLRQKLYDT